MHFQDLFQWFADHPVRVLMTSLPVALLGGMVLHFKFDRSELLWSLVDCLWVASSVAAFVLTTMVATSEATRAGAKAWGADARGRTEFVGVELSAIVAGRCPPPRARGHECLELAVLNRRVAETLREAQPNSLGLIDALPSLRTQPPEKNASRRAEVSYLNGLIAWANNAISAYDKNAAKVALNGPEMFRAAWPVWFPFIGSLRLHRTLHGLGLFGWLNAATRGLLSRGRRVEVAALGLGAGLPDHGGGEET